MLSVPNWVRHCDLPRLGSLHRIRGDGSLRVNTLVVRRNTLDEVGANSVYGAITSLIPFKLLAGSIENVSESDILDS